MGKNNRHKKFEKKEKSKVKLKGKKTLLPKGQNVTDTSFKVKKIVIREQLKTDNTNEPLSRRKLNVKDLTSRLQHYNTSARQDGLSGLKELVTSHSSEVLSSHLSSIIEGAVHLTLDRETSVRREALKLLKMVLVKVSPIQVAPFFDVLQSYLSCAMTHIHTVIQEDSLLLLDTLLETVPALVAASSHKILPNFLDMISKLRTEAKPERTLMVNLGSKLTSVTWRIKVFHRLRGLLEAIISRKSDGDGNENFQNSSMNKLNTTYYWENDAQLNIALYNPHYYGKVCHLPSLFNGTFRCCGTSSGEDDTLFASREGHLMQGYVNVLMPLLFETWLEVGPGTDKAKQMEQEENLLSGDAGAMLQCILEIMQLLWEYLQCWQEEANFTTLRGWFKSMYKKDFRRYMLPGFPYMQNEIGSSNTSKKRKRQEDVMFLRKGAVKCVAQNLAICHLFCCLQDTPKLEECTKIIHYLKQSLLKWDSTESAAIVQLLRVLRCLLVECSKEWSSRGVDVTPMLEATIVCYTRAGHNRELSRMLLRLLCDIVLDTNLEHLHSCRGFETWLAALPNLLCQPGVSAKVVGTLLKLASQRNPVFDLNLRKKLPEILDNLDKVTVLGAENIEEGRQSIANTLYWISRDQKETHKLITLHLHTWDSNLAKYVSELLPALSEITVEKMPGSKKTRMLGVSDHGLPLCRNVK